MSKNGPAKAMAEDNATRAWKAWQPHLGPERVQFWKHSFPNWPPKDGTPPMAIEPYGKQFFVYRARRRVQALTDPRAPCQMDAKPDWIQDEIRKEMKVWKDIKLTQAEANLEENQEVPMLCVTDYRQRVLGYLSRNEWEGFRKLIPRLKKNLEYLKTKNPPPKEQDEVTEIEALKRIFTWDRNRYMRIGSSGSQNLGDVEGYRIGKPKGQGQRLMRRKRKKMIAQSGSVLDRKMRALPAMSVAKRRVATSLDEINNRNVNEMINDTAEWKPAQRRK